MVSNLSIILLEHYFYRKSYTKAYLKLYMLNNMTKQRKEGVNGIGINNIQPTEHKIHRKSEDRKR